VSALIPQARSGGRRLRMWEIIEVMPPGDRLSRRLHAFIMTLILLNVIAVMLSTVAGIEARWGAWLEAFEIFSVLCFTAEYVARLWSCTADPRYTRPWLGRLRMMATPMALIDLLAVLPFYLTFLHADLRILRVMRLIRIVRIAKLGRYLDSLDLFRRVIRQEKEALILTGSFLMAVAIVASALMYFTESAVQPDKFPSIPATLWWALVTMTTVGYGDVFPVTPLGRVLGALTALMGVVTIALPTAIIGSAFLRELEKMKEPAAKPAPPKTVCPHCGKPVD
jgi:voltage-gated potassium channel